MEKISLPVLFSSPEKIADHWFDALCRTPTALGNSTPLRAELGDLTVACLHFLTAEESDPRTANDIGVRLAHLLSNQPDALGCTQKFWMHQVMLVAGNLDPDEIYERGTHLLSGIAVGFTRTLRETILSEQGGITRLIADQTIETQEELSRERVLARALTERTRELQQLSEKYRRQALILENVFDAVIVTDTNRQIVDWNQGASRMWGYTSEEVIGRNTQFLYAYPQIWIPWNEWIALIQAQGALLSQFDYRRKDGSVGIGESTLVPLYDDNNTVIGIIGVNRDITARANLQEDLQRSNKELEALNRIADTLAETRDLESILNRIANSADQLMHADRIRISVPNETETQFITRALVSNMFETYNVPMPVHSIVGWVYQNCKPENLARLADHPWLYEIEGHPEDRELAGVFVPLLHGEKNLGVLSAMRSGEHPFTEAEVQLLRALASHAAIAIENGKLFDSTKHQLLNLTALDELSRKLFASRDTQAIMQLAVTRTAELLHAQQSSIRRISGNMLVSEAYVTTTDDPFYSESIPIEPLHYALLNEGKEIIVDDMNTLMLSSPLEERVKSLHIKSLLALPLRLGQTTFRILGIARFETHPRWTPEELTLARNLANIIAIALHNAQQYQDLEKHAYYLSELSEFATELHSISKLDAVMYAACRRVLKVLQGTRSSIRTVEGDALTVGVSLGYQNPEGREHSIQIDSRLRSLVDGKQPLIIPDIRQDPHIPARRLKRMLAEDSIAFLGMPMQTKEKVIGILSIAQAQAHEWTAEEIKFVETVANITAIALERARNEIDVKDEQEQFHAMVDSLQMAVFRTDRNGRITFWNHAAQEMSGWRKDQVLQLNWHDLFTNKLSTVPELLKQVLATNRPSHSSETLWLHTVERGDIPVSMGLAPVHDQDGQVRDVVGNFQDLSELQEARKARDEFFASLAHDLVNPLSTLQFSLTTYAAPKSKRADRQKSLAYILAQTNRLKAFAETYLYAARPQTEEPVPLAPVEIVSLIQRVLLAYPTTDGEHTFVFVVPPIPIWVLADDRRLERVLFNLYDNALKYSPQGGHIETRIEVLADKIQIAVRDEGVGIPPGELENIFNRWYRVRMAQGQYAYGHGIGLWLVRLHMDAMQGRVWAMSNGHTGSTFYIELQPAKEN